MKPEVNGTHGLGEQEHGEGDGERRAPLGEAGERIDRRVAAVAAPDQRHDGERPDREHGVEQQVVGDARDPVAGRVVAGRLDADQDETGVG